MEGVNPDTVWTWNAIGKRSGAWNLSTDAPESRKGFLLNHVISEFLPPDADGAAASNTDPVTGQAAWYDLRVRVEKRRPPSRNRAASRHAAPPASAASAAASCASPTSRGGEDAMTAIPRRPGQKKLGLVIDLDTCVGCHACAVNCKEWNTSGHSAPLTDFDAYQANSRRASGSTACTATRPATGARQPHRAFPPLLPALRGAGLRHRLPHRRVVQARRGRHRAGQHRHLHRLQAVFLGLPVRRARVRRG